MSESTKTVLAVPSMGEGGFNAERSGHFGQCDCFTVVDIDNGVAGEPRVVDNPPHVEGGCLRPVELLSSNGVTALIVAGIGPTPLASFNNAGITVYFDDRLPIVGQAVAAVREGNAQVIGSEGVCSGCGGH